MGTQKDKTGDAKLFAGMVVDAEDMCMLELDYKVYVVTHAFALEVFKVLNSAPIISRDFDTSSSDYVFKLQHLRAADRGAVAKMEPLSKAQLAQAVMAYNPED
jgi:hypothetical protein